MKRKSFRGKEPHRAVLWMKKRVQASEEGPLPGPTAKQVRLGGDHGSPTTGPPLAASVLQEPGKPQLFQNWTGSLPKSRESASQASGWQS